MPVSSTWLFVSVQFERLRKSHVQFASEACVICHLCRCIQSQIEFLTIVKHFAMCQMNVSQTCVHVIEKRFQCVVSFFDAGDICDRLLCDCERRMMVVILRGAILMGYLTRSLCSCHQLEHVEKELTWKKWCRQFSKSVCHNILHHESSIPCILYRSSSALCPQSCQAMSHPKLVLRFYTELDPLFTSQVDLPKWNGARSDPELGCVLLSNLFIFFQNAPYIISQ